LKRLVIDTGVVISASLKKAGTSRKAFVHAVNEFIPLLSLETIIELENVLNRPKFERFILPEDVTAILERPPPSRGEWCTVFGAESTPPFRGVALPDPDIVSNLCCQGVLFVILFPIFQFIYRIQYFIYLTIIPVFIQHTIPNMKPE
jgi:hypothetical protein